MRLHESTREHSTGGARPPLRTYIYLQRELRDAGTAPERERKAEAGQRAQNYNNMADRTDMRELRRLGTPAVSCDMFKLNRFERIPRLPVLNVPLSGFCVMSPASLPVFTHAALVMRTA
jgi:hypothetical protein